MIDFTRFDSLVSLATYFSSTKRCKDALVQSRWSDGDVVCPYCGRHHCYSCKDGRYKCPGCHSSFSVLVGTIFENTKISLIKWFMTMYLISSHKKGISSCQLARDIKVTQKTAWFILHKLRTLYSQDDSVALEGEVECDEMYLGGREKNKHQNKKTQGTQGGAKTKNAIFGMAERSGDVKSFAVPDTKSETLKAYIKQFCADNVVLFTDESSVYNGLDDEYIHKHINHSKNEYSTNGVTTNTIEGFWAHFKRMVFGTYHFVSKGYLQPYIDESVYRWNTRKTSETTRFQDMFNKSIGVCSYKTIKGLKVIYRETNQVSF